MKKFITNCIFLFTLLIIHYLGTVPAGASDLNGDNPVLFSVDGVSYTLGDLRTFIVRDPSMQGRAVTKGGVRRVLEDFIDSKVFRLEGLRTNFSAGKDIEDDSLGYYYAVQFSLLGKCPEPDEGAIKEYFDEHQQSFSSPPLVRIERIALPQSASLENMKSVFFLKNRAEKIRAGEADFTTLIEQVKKNLPEISSMQGDMGFQMIRPQGGGADSFEEQVASAKKDEVVGPIEQEGYIFLFKVTDRREPVPVKWEDVSNTGQVERAIYAKCMSERLQSVRKTLYERFNVELNQVEVDKLTPLGS